MEAQQDTGIQIRLHKGWGVLYGEDSVDLWSYVTQSRLRVRGSTPQLAQFFEILENGVPETDASELISSASGIPQHVVNSFLQTLRNAGAVIRIPIHSDFERYGPQTELYLRQTGYFDYWETEGRNGQQLDYQLRHRKIVIVGVGGYGCWMLLLLARMGVRNLVAIDPDTIEESNLHRQVLYSREDIGRLKVEAAETRLRDSDPDISYVGHAVNISSQEDLVPLIRGADLVIDPFGFRSLRLRDIITSACMSANVPTLLCGGTTLGPLTVFGESPCPECVIGSHSGIRSLQETMRSNVWHPPSAAFAPPMAMLAAAGMLEVSRFLSGSARPITLDGMVTFNTHNDSMSFSRFERNPECPICGSYGLGSGWRRGSK